MVGIHAAMPQAPLGRRNILVSLRDNYFVSYIEAMKNLGLRTISIVLLLTPWFSGRELLAQASAGVPGSSELSKLQDVDLHLVRFLNDGKEILLPPAAKITLTFRKEGQISGRSAVNNYAGRFTEEPNGAIAIQLTTSTQMAGPAESMKLEREYFDALSHVKHFQLTSDQIILENGPTSMTFTYSRSK